MMIQKTIATYVYNSSLKFKIKYVLYVTTSIYVILHIRFCILYVFLLIKSLLRGYYHTEYTPKYIIS